MTNQTSEWLTIREASLSLGVSELTVRRRIKDGRLSHRLVHGKYFVSLAGANVDSNIQGAITGRSSVKKQSPTRAVEESDPVSSGDIVPSRGSDHPIETQGNGRHESGRSIDLVALVEEHTRLAEIAGRARLLEEQLRELERRHAELQDGAISLASRNGWLESKLEEREQALKLLIDTRRKRPWWKRLVARPPEEY